MSLSKPALGPLAELVGPALAELLRLVTGGAARAAAPLQELASDALDACGAGQERLRSLALELAGEGCVSAGGPLLSLLVERGGRLEAQAKRALRTADRDEDEDREETRELAWLAAPLAMSVLAAPCGVLAPGLVLSGLTVPMKVMFVAAFGVLSYATMKIIGRPAAGNGRWVRWGVALSMGTSSCFHLAMAIWGPFVIPLPESVIQVIQHPLFVWPILQDFLVVPLQLTALWCRTQSDLTSMAPAVCYATVKTAGAIAMMTFPAYQMYGLAASFAGFVLLSQELCEMDVSASPQAVQDRAMATGDVQIIGWGLVLAVESLIMSGIAPDEAILRIFIGIDVLSKFCPGYLLTK